MAASLETLDQIRDSLINRGIGASGLTGQAIQRANLPELRTELATANAIRLEEQNRRESRIKAKSLGNLAISQAAEARGGADKIVTVGLGSAAGSGGTQKLETRISGLQGISGAFVTSGEIPQFVQDIKAMLSSSSGTGAVRLENSTGGLNTTLDGLLEQLRSSLKGAGLKVI